MQEETTKEINRHPVTVCPRCGCKRTKSVAYGCGEDEKENFKVFYKRRCTEPSCKHEYQITEIHRDEKLIERTVT